MTTQYLPSTLTLLPLPPPQVLFPYLRVSLSLNSAQLAVVLKSIADNARVQKLDDSVKLLAVVPVVEIERRVGRWATAARVVKIDKSKADEGMYRVVLEGLVCHLVMPGTDEQARIRLPRSLPPVLSILPQVPLPISTYSLPLNDGVNDNRLLPLAQTLLPKQLHARLTSLTPSMLCDLLVTILGFDWETRVEVLGLADMEERSAKVKELLVGVMANRGIPPPIDTDPAPRSTSQALIRRPRPVESSAQSSLPEDLQPLFALLNERLPELTPSAKSTVVRELTRLSKIPPQSAEYGVGKTYIEWLLSLPWKKVNETRKELDLEEAKRRLEEDHEGLHEVKRRVIEYLAVYRLKKRRFLEQMEKDQKEQPAKQGAGMIDSATAGELLDLIPASDRKSAQEPLPTSETDDGPPTDVFRDKGPILLLVGPPGVGKTLVAVCTAC
jgi:ATP-dependent Lon protease